MSLMIQKWEELCTENKFFGFLNIMLMGFSQIAFHCNPVCGMILLASVAVVSPVQLLSGVWASFVAAVFIRMLKIPPKPVREGLYTMNPALAGLALPLVMKIESPGLSIAAAGGAIHFSVFPAVFMLSTIGGILAVTLTAGLRKFLSRWQLPALAAPYSFTLLLMSLTVYVMRPENAGLKVSSQVLVYPEESSLLWGFRHFIMAALNGVAQVLWIEGVEGSVIAGLLILAGIMAASRRDALITVYVVCLATGFAAILGLDRNRILLGIYGYNAILLSLALFGRDFRADRYSFLMITILSMASVGLTAVLGRAFAVIGAPVAAFPFLILAMGAMIGKRCLGNKQRNLG